MLISFHSFAIVGIGAKAIIFYPIFSCFLFYTFFFCLFTEVQLINTLSLENTNPSAQNLRRFSGSALQRLCIACPPNTFSPPLPSSLGLWQVSEDCKRICCSVSRYKVVWAALCWCITQRSI